MKYLLAVLWLVPVAVAQASDDGVQVPSQNGLSIAIVLAKIKSGSSIIDRGGMFPVVFRNESREPIRLWTGSCRLGYETLSFRVEEGNGQSWLMYKLRRHPSDWKNGKLETITIRPGGTFSWQVAPSGIWGDRVWKGVPEPNTGKAITLTAIFEIKPTDDTKKHRVWTGRITSLPIETLVVDPKLRTPHEYLWAGFPKQALKIMQDDPKWIGKRDDDRHTPLHLAGRFGFTEVVRWLLSHGADVNARCYNDFTPLNYTSHLEVVKLLLEHKADVNAKGAGGTALQRAAGDYAHWGQYPEYASERAKCLAITKLLLDAGAEYDIRSACYLGDVKRVQAVLGDKKEAPDRDAMRIAASYGQEKIVKLLLENGGDPEDADFGGLTASYFAIEHPGVLKLLFDAGANPHVDVTYHGNGHGPEGSTLLHEAGEKGIVESAKLLLSRGVDVNVRNRWGATPLHMACYKGHAAMVDYLLKNKADASARARDGETPMSMAESQVRPEQEEDNARYQAVIRRLERAGVDVDIFAAIACNDVERVVRILQNDAKAGNRRNPAGRPALQRAVTLDRTEIVKRLLAKGCDPNIRSEDKRSGYEGETALLDAAFWGRLTIAQMLIQQGADVNMAAANGVMPLHEAARMNHIELAKLLLEHGANVNAKNDKGETPLDWADSNDKEPEMIKLLRSLGGRGKDIK